MTRQHLQKMQRARRRAAERRRREDLESIRSYRSWVKLEARAYRALVQAREMFGPDSAEASAAHDDWRFAMSGIPAMSTLPADSTWRALRGEVAA